MQMNADFYKNILENYIPAHRFLGLKLLEIKEGWAKMQVPYRDEFLGDPRTGRWHGGLISLAMDSVGGAAGFTAISLPDDKISTIDIRVDYLRPTTPESLIVEGEIVRSGNRIIATKMKAYHVSSPEVLIAEGRAVYNVNRKE